MTGSTGNDTYVADNAGDVVTELANEGTDLVQSWITYTLGANVENLTLTGTAAINGTGNTLNNLIIGNGAANILTGLNGNDTLTGGTGNDTYLFNTGDGTDTINNNDSTGFDVVSFLAGIENTSVGLFKNGNNLDIG
jgi:Ca2+-binding RTX toxin-like protein